MTPIDMRSTIECAYCCTIPAELGRVLELDVTHGKVIAETESGIPMIVPLRQDGCKNQHPATVHIHPSVRIERKEFALSDRLPKKHDTVIFDEATDWPNDGSPLF